MKTRNLQIIADEQADSLSAEPKNDSTKSANLVELNKLGVQKALVEKDYRQAIEFFSNLCPKKFC